MSRRQKSRHLMLVTTMVRWFSRFLLLFIATSVLLVLVLRWVAPPASSFMLQSHFQGEPAGSDQRPTIHYDWVSYLEISPVMALAVIAAEDQRFPLHGGFDFHEIKKALKTKAEGGALRGASTITQQVAKNLFLWPGRSLLRKGMEAWFTMLIEILWSKRRILEMYLNIAEMGAYTFGAEAASQRFFRKRAAQLSQAEAALLAAVLPNPVRYRVDSPSPHVRRRQAWILRQMRQLGGVRYLEDL